MKILSVIITYNSEYWIKKNITSILNNSEGVDIEILVVDNASNDSTINIIKNNFPEVKIIESGKNLGFGAANNLAFLYALEIGYDFVFLINHDGWLLPEFWKKTLPILSDEEYTKYGLLSPIHFDATLKDFDFGFKRYLGNTLGKNNNEVINVDLINGAFLFISKECLIKVRGFDPIFFFYGEDIDLCLRAKKKGYKIGIIKNASVVHDRKERVLSDDRIWNHLVANHLIQIKSISGGFYKSFFKTNYSIFVECFRNISDKKQSKNYLRLFFYLLRNISQIKNAYYNFN
ncbi:glycosyltransferase family 2 protein [Epilithonimonas ginsengisoli]|uniref:Glycosyltransferase family 2 protein n=1 Tax=Epilithonimonas ginsengisoli TaxID=1245592 RepID=A0ABU4JIK1_9FLAO|nr:MULTISPECIES: glycosyltransferase family 2 protein [Chryseobacterium group]MBV6879082.1 glycosyltransferase family 2 protein [Epilithonimonas sp. FP105]MDW8549516.1 glycosyltransferase family 2 protein [Epilithonimonas ginsengisoli]OAH74381.1 hypothetical protein AXA65_06365 [Chryseobacterium sp. FP211-J200]